MPYGKLALDTIETSGNLSITGNTTISNNLTVSGNTSVTGNLTASNFSTQSTFGFKNRIINGGMVIDQRNAGASVTVNTSSSTFGVDRFYGVGQPTDGVFTIQQSSASPPTGFINYVRATVTTADASIGASQYYDFGHRIEGLNMTDFGWGTANASTVTLSFLVRSSLTGTFGGTIRNSSIDRNYTFTYTINSANTWEQKTITIAGDTTGTWLTTNGVGMIIVWGLGEGSSRLGTPGTWQAANYSGATGQTNLISTLNATWDITGVQLEKGSTATSFDWRPYGTELLLCQRYYYQLVKDMNGANPWPIMAGYWWNTTTAVGVVPLPVNMRSAPTISVNTGSGFYRFYWNGTNTSATTALTTFTLDISSTTVVYLTASASSGGTGGMAGNYSTWNSGASIGISSEL